MVANEVTVILGTGSSSAFTVTVNVDYGTASGSISTLDLTVH